MTPTIRAFRLLAFAFALVVSCIGRAAAASASGALFLELDVAIERGGVVAAIFDFGDGIWGENTVMAQVPHGATPTPVRLALPERPIRGLRFDPGVDDQPVAIAGMRLVDERGTVLLRMDPRRFRPMQQVREIVPDGDGVRVIPISGANDPVLRIDIGLLQQKLHELSGRATVGTTTVVVLALALAAMVVGAVWVAWRALGGAWESEAREHVRGLQIGGAAIFAAVLGARLVALNYCGRPVPFWDEWEGDALYVVMPFVGGFLDWGALVMPQWEHRILLTRAITLIGVVLNGEWDVRVAMTVSAALYAAMIALVGTAMLATGTRVGLVVAAGLAVGAALPFDVNNLLWGGQTQMYGLGLMAVVTIVLAAAPRASVLVQVAALAGGLGSLFTMGAGPVGPACAAGICLLRCWYEREQRGALLRMAAIFVGVAALGVWLHTSSRAHVPLYATSVAQFKRAFVGVLAWPLVPHGFWAALLWAPWIVNGVGILRRRAGAPLEWMGAGLGTWALINAIALGYARQYEGPPFDSRFFTPIAMGAIASLCCSAAWLIRGRDTRSRLLPALAAVAAIGGFVSVGVKGITLAQETGATRAELDHRIRVFLSSGDPTLLIEKPPHHTGLVVVERLESPLLQRVLPAPYRRALAARVEGSGGATKNAEAQAGPLTLVVRTLMKMGPVVAALGVAGLAVLAWQRKWRPDRGEIQRGLKHGATPDWMCYGAVVLVTIGWVLAYNATNPHGLVDEPGHVANVHHFLDGKPGWPEAMPMLPGYHYLVLSLWELYPGMSTLTAARWTTALLSLAGFAAFALAWTRIHGRSAGRATLLLALLPLTHPFTGMAYTDMPALALVLIAWWAQVSGRRLLAVLALVAAVMLRQTSLAWAAFFLAWEWWRDDEPRGSWFARTRWLGLLLLAAGVAIAAAGRLTVGAQHGNEFKFNVASVHFAAALLLVLGLPVWVVHARTLVMAWREARSPWLAPLALAAVVIVATTFANPHIWNRALFWEGCTFTLLRNWPLVWIEAHPWLRILSAVNVVAMAAAIGFILARQRHGQALACALLVGAAPVVTNGLVEPRYLIPGAAFALFFLEIDAADWRRLVAWWGVLCLVHAPFVARGLSLW